MSWYRRMSQLTVAFVLSSTLVSAQDDHEDLLRQAEQAAEQFQSASGEDKSQLQKRIEAMVAKSFDARQALQQQQLAAMQNKLEQTKKAIEARQSLRERIIERKVEDLLTGQAADWQPGDLKPAKSFGIIQPGDFLMMEIPGILPYTPPNETAPAKPVHILESGKMAVGYPIPVDADGAVQLPFLGLVEVAGLDVRQAEARIVKGLVDRKILREDRITAFIMLVPEEEARFKVANADEEAVTVVRETVPIPLGSAASTSTFDDTYGRIETAIQLVRDYEDAAATVKRHQLTLEQTDEEITALNGKDDQTSQVKRTASQLKRRAASESIRVSKEAMEAIRLRLELERDYLLERS
ncbi:MAG: polysaccharide biosynthesis/export family protein, partial [Planctomycetota bacterium]